ncbi:MAG: histidine kinase [Bacteroidales bacterium]|nr:histidine kinase [Bacteroidales bacterium]
MHYKQFSGIIGLVLLAITLYAQRPSFIHYGPAEGLSSPVVYQVIQDKKGLIWFATANGLSRYDGSHFKTYHTNDGLNSISITSIAEGKSGELFIANYEKGINLLRDDKITSFCSKIKEKSFSTSLLIIDTNTPDGQQLYAFRAWGNIAQLHEKNGTFASGRFLNIPGRLTRMGLLSDGNKIALTSNGIYQVEADTMRKLNINGLPDQPYYCFSSPALSHYILGAEDAIYRIDSNQVSKVYRLGKGNLVSEIHEDLNGNIWFSVMNKGYYFIPSGTQKVVDYGSRMGLEHTTVNGYMEDDEGNIWISTHGKGVYCLNNLYIRILNESDGLNSNLIYSLTIDRFGDLIAGTLDGLYQLKDDVFRRIHHDYNTTLTEYIHKLNSVNDTIYVCSGYLGNNRPAVVQYGNTYILTKHISVCRGSHGRIYEGTGFNTIYVVDAGSLKEIRQNPYTIIGDSVRVNRVNEIFEDSGNRLWVGTSQGLCLISEPMNTAENGQWHRRYFNGPLANRRINAIIETRDQTIWIGGEFGIGFINPRSDSVISIYQQDGFDLSNVNSLAVDQHNRLWIGTVNGLFLLEGEKIMALSEESGLPSDEIHSLCFDPVKSLLYVGTSNGVALIDIPGFDLYQTVAPVVRISSVIAGDSVYTDFTQLSFKPGQRNVNIGYTAMHYASPGTILYQYKLNNEWVTTKHNFLDLVSLKHGRYAFQIRAKAQNTGWGEPVTLSFQVLPEFTETIWFFGLLAFLLLVATILAGLWRKRLFIRKTQEARAISERFNQLKHEALSAMMNPHFISNALNSVQYLINSNRNEEANNAIAMIARLMRKNIETAGNGFILLSEEIARLQLYLDLEQLRFGNLFTYHIHTDISINADTILIPNMIIQPLVENSIWHGIIHSKRPGLLTITFSFNQVEHENHHYQTLIIKIVDNGIGMQASRQFRQDSHISKGIQIIEERLEILSANLMLAPPIIFEDLTDQATNKQGTEVIIALPPGLFQLVNNLA